MFIIQLNSFSSDIQRIYNLMFFTCIIKRLLAIYIDLLCLGLVTKYGKKRHFYSLVIFVLGLFTKYEKNPRD